MKRILCIALTLLLGLALLAPAVSAASDDPVFTAQAKTSDGALFAGNTLTLSAAATVPAGGTLRIDWYAHDWQPGDDDKGDAHQAIATGANVEYTVPLPNNNLFWRDASSQNLHIYAVAKNFNAEGEMVGWAKSGPVDIIVVQPLAFMLSQMWDGWNQDWDEGFSNILYGIGQMLWSSPITFIGFLTTFLPGYLFLWILTLVK